MVRFSDKFPFVAPSETQPGDISKSGFVAYQVATLILVLLIPAAALFHLNKYVFYDRGRVWNASVRSIDGARVIDTIPFLSPTAEGRTVLDSPKQNNGKADFRLADRMEDIMTERHEVDKSKPRPEYPPSAPCKQDTSECTGVTWSPLWSPLVLWTLTPHRWEQAQQRC